MKDFLLYNSRKRSEIIANVFFHLQGERETEGGRGTERQKGEEGRGREGDVMK